MLSEAGRLLQAAVLLAVTKKQHPHSPGLLLSLSALQMLLGNGDRALESFQEVAPRSVQLDSLAHHVMPVLAELPSVKHRTLLRMARPSPCRSLLVQCTRICACADSTHPQLSSF